MSDSDVSVLQVRIKEIPVLDKLQYLHCLLSSVLPIVKQIHQEQCFEVELEKKLRSKMLISSWYDQFNIFACHLHIV